MKKTTRAINEVTAGPSEVSGALQPAFALRRDVSFAFHALKDLGIWDKAQSLLKVGSVIRTRTSAKIQLNPEGPRPYCKGELEITNPFLGETAREKNLVFKAWYCVGENGTPPSEDL